MARGSSGVWWKLMLAGLALAVYDLFAYQAIVLLESSGQGRLWAPVALLYGHVGRDRTIGILAGVAAVFILAGVVSMVGSRRTYRPRCLQSTKPPMFCEW